MKRKIGTVMATLLCTSMSSFGDATVSGSRLSRTDLMLFHDPAGQTRPVKSVGDWQKRRAEILAGMQEITGPLPGKEKRCELRFTVKEEVDCGSHLRRLVHYGSEPG